MKSIYTINSRKFDGEIHRTWSAELVSESEGMLEVFGIFENDVVHRELGFIKKGTGSREYYWRDRGFNVFRFQEPDGSFRNFYCNIIFPPVFTGNVIDYIDLDIDVLVEQDFSVKVLDLEEFAENCMSFPYPDEIRLGAERDLSEVLSMIESRLFPFNITD